MKKQPTQGEIKHFENITNLLKNEKFMERLKQIRETDWDDKTHKKSQLITNFLSDYNLPLYDPFILRLWVEGSTDIDVNDIPDEMCRWSNQFDEYFDPNTPKYRPFEDDDIKQEGMNRFPLAIYISPMASKRDLLDYIRIKWPEIRKDLDRYGKQKRIRRRTKREEQDFLWENRNLPVKRIAEEFYNNFKKVIGEEEIYSKINLERKRRT